MRTFVSELQSFICPDEPAGKIVVDYRDVGTGGQRGSNASPRILTGQLTLSQPKGEEGCILCAFHYYLLPPCTPSEFSDLLTALD